MEKSINTVCVYVESGPDGKIQIRSMEALGCAKDLARAVKACFCAVILGSNTKQAAKELSYYGLEKIYAVDHPLLETFEPEASLKALKRACELIRPDLLFFGHSLAATDLCARASFELDAGLVTDCVKAEITQNKLELSKPVYSGNVMAVYEPTDYPCILMLRPRAYEPVERADSSSAEIIQVSIDIKKEDLHITNLGRVVDDADGLKLADADVVVAGGRGMGGSEGFAMLNKLAEKLNGVLGASRPPCDLEWVSPKTQVGLTGEIVGPQLYFAVGISGSFQHLAGMVDSKVIVAINPDEKANIFKVANYGVVGEYEEVVPSIISVLE